MPGRLYSSEENYDIIIESFQNRGIAIAEICRERSVKDVGATEKCSERKA